MSRILRRPMFRGGRVDSRGTGITSGLMDDTGYADGGQIGGGTIAGDLMPDGRYGFQNPRLIDLGGGRPTPTTSTIPGLSTNILPESFLNRMENYGRNVRSGARFLNPFVFSKPIALAASPALTIGGLAYLNKPENQAELDFMMENREILDKETTDPNLYEGYFQGRAEARAAGEKAEQPKLGFFETLFGKKETPVKESKELLEEGKKAYLEQERRDQEERDRLTKRKDISEINIEDIEKESKLYQKLLGGEEAKQQAIYDALLAASPAFFKGRNLREAAPEVLTAINKSSAFDKPRDIKQAAAQLAIQRRMLVDKATAEGKAKADLNKPSTFSEAILQYGKGQEPTPYLVKQVAQMFTGEPPLDVPGAKVDETTGNLINYKQDKLIPNKFYVSGSSLYIARYNPDGRLVLVKRG